MDRLRIATAWLGGCSGCHMSFLDTDEWLMELAGKVELVYSPIMDVKEYPENVDVALVEGAVANEDNLELLLRIRRNTRLLVSFGDCAITGNVTAMRNMVGPAAEVLKSCYIDNAVERTATPASEGILPRLLDRVSPLHEYAAVDFYLPGCPPPAERIIKVLEAVLKGETPELEEDELRFG